MRLCFSAYEYIHICYSFAIKKSKRWSAASLHKIVHTCLHCEPHFVWQLFDLNNNNHLLYSTMGEQKRGGHLIVDY